MIITSLATKDTYVTNLKTQHNEGTTANFGQASTLDLFKIVGENKNIKSRALLNFIDVDSRDSHEEVVNENTFKIIDYLGQEVVFITDTRTAQELGDAGLQNGSIVDNKTVIWITRENPFDLSHITTQIFNAISARISDGSLAISAGRLSDGSIYLEQNKEGVIGDTDTSTDYTINGLTVVPIPSPQSGGKSNYKITPFRRFEHSAALLTFDLEKLYTENISTYGNSIFSSSTDFRANIVLKDVGMLSTSSKGFKVRLKVLSNDFDEGLGRDTVHFSDLDKANFQNISDNVTWTSSGFVSLEDTYFENNGGSYTYYTDTFEVKAGNEDLVFDVTDYIFKYFSSSGADRAALSKSFVLFIDYENMFDEYTYFAKRLSSRHVSNKLNAPRLELSLNDKSDKLHNIIFSDKKRYLDNKEEFYLTNIIDKAPKAFATTTDTEIRLKLYKDSVANANEIKLNSSMTAGEDDTNYLSASKLYNYKGSEITGVKKFIVDKYDASHSDNRVPDTTILTSANNDFSSDLSSKGYVKIIFRYYYYIGASTTEIKTDEVKYYLPEFSNSDLNKKLRVSLDIADHDIHADDSFKKLYFSFIDVVKQYDAVKVPIQLVSEDLGDVTYEVYDVDTGQALVTGAEDFGDRCMSFNGKNYVMNLYVPEYFAGRRASFIFTYTDILSGLKIKLKDSKLVVGFK